MDHVLDDCVALPTGPLSGGAGGAPGDPEATRMLDESASLAALWTELISGFCKVEYDDFTQHTCSVVVSRGRRQARPDAQRLPTRDLEILERSLLEGVRKSVAADFGLCPSSIAEILRRCFAFMGLACWPSRIPLILVMAAHAKHARPSARGAKAILAQNQQYPRQRFSVARPDDQLVSWLSPAEYAVTRLLVEGKSYEEMALLRHTSKRTVANQLASAFHRLGISGRAELLCLLAQRSVAAWQAAPISTRAFGIGVPEPAPGFARIAPEPAL